MKTWWPFCRERITLKELKEIIKMMKRKRNNYEKTGKMI